MKTMCTALAFMVYKNEKSSNRKGVPSSAPRGGVLWTGRQIMFEAGVAGNCAPLCVIGRCRHGHVRCGRNNLRQVQH